MSRSGYTDDCDGWALIRWRGAVKSAISGERGQAFLRELAAALDAMPTKELAAHSFRTEGGEFCTLGVIANARGVDVSGLDPKDDYCREPVGKLLDIAPAMAAEIMHENDRAIDEFDWIDVPIFGPFLYHWQRDTYSERVPNEGAAAKRWQYMRKWVGEHLRASGAASEGA